MRTQGTTWCAADPATRLRLILDRAALRFILENGAALTCSDVALALPASESLPSLIHQKALRYLVKWRGHALGGPWGMRCRRGTPGMSPARVSTVRVVGRLQQAQQPHIVWERGGLRGTRAGVCVGVFGTSRTVHNAGYVWVVPISSR